jgi:hypothetical protein
MWIWGAVIFAVGILPAKTCIVFRYDDFSADPNGVRTPLRGQIWKAEQEVGDLFTKYHFPYLVGIVPGSDPGGEYGGWLGKADFSVQQDSEKVLWLRQAVQENRVEVAQHGFRHQRNTAAGHARGEFREIPYTQQRQNLKRGKAMLMEALEGCEPRVFIPPWNAWDGNTAKALKQEGFSVLSADCSYFYGQAKGLNILPLTISLQELEKILDSGSLPDEAMLVVNYHPVELFVFPESLGVNEKNQYFGLERFERLLSRLSRMPEVEVTTPLRLLQQGHDLSWRRYWKAYKVEQIYHFWDKILPKQICPNVTRMHIYLTSSQYAPLLWMALLQHGGLALLVIAMGWTAYSLYQKAGLPGRPRRIGFAMVAVVAACVIMEWDSLRRGFRLTATRALPGLAAVGVILSMLWDKRKAPKAPEEAVKLLPEFQQARWKAILLLGLCMAASLVIHFHFKIHGYGEGDACEMGNMALELYHTGTLYEYSYRIRTSVLYVQFLKMMLDYGLPPVALPDFMNNVNVVAGTLLLPALYLLWRRLAAIRTVAATLILLSFAPAFWQGNIYGMPHIPAMLFFLISLNLFYYFMYARGPVRYLFYVLSILFGILTVGFKADLMLGFGIYFVLLYRRTGLNASRCLPCFWPMAIPVLFVMTYSQMMYPALTGFAKFSKDWSTTFPFTPRALTDAKNITATICSVGPVMFCASLTLMAIGIWRKVRPTILLSVIFWALPLAAFWGLRLGNSARHMMMVVTIVLFYAVVVLSSLCKSNLKFFGILFLLIVLNYPLTPDSLLPRTYRPSSKIFQSPAYLQATVSRWHELGRQFAQSPAPQKIIFSCDNIYYVLWETLCRQEQFQIIDTPRVFAFQEGEQTRLVRSVVDYKGYVTDKDRQNVISRYPDWEIWEWVSSENNTKFDLVLLHSPGGS